MEPIEIDLSTLTLTLWKKEQSTTMENRAAAAITQHTTKGKLWKRRRAPRGAGPVYYPSSGRQHHGSLDLAMLQISVCDSSTVCCRLPILPPQQFHLTRRPVSIMHAACMSRYDDCGVQSISTCFVDDLQSSGLNLIPTDIYAASVARTTKLIRHWMLFSKTFFITAMQLQQKPQSAELQEAPSVTNNRNTTT